ncbi:MAG: HAD family hydrolase [Myxococcales bacterium]|nr:HAD family hydrolase [Myxococcales bacterium]
MRALLFDLDGTLTEAGGGGSRALGRALHARPQAAEELRKMRLDGMTDRAIARTLLTAEKKSVGERDIDEVLEHYLQALAIEVAQRPYKPLPGVGELLRALQSRALLGLCTGNVARGAELKLSSAGLWRYWQFGGYGSDAEPRADIVRIAFKRAQALGATDALVIGDTPRDILAAHDAGLPACGVATGRWSVHDLATHGAEKVIAGFSDVRTAIDLLLG